MKTDTKDRIRSAARRVVALRKQARADAAFGFRDAVRAKRNRIERVLDAIERVAVREGYMEAALQAMVAKAGAA